jgi:hypothetical protein
MKIHVKYLIQLTQLSHNKRKQAFKKCIYLVEKK